jgi:capsular exopolysaccharide synthesis family protein
MAQLITTEEPRSAISALLKGRSILEIAWSRKFLVGLGVVVGLALGLVYYNQSAPVYQSKAQVLIVKKRHDSVTGIDTRNLSIEDFVATHKTLVESPLIIEKAIEQHHLDGLECFDGADDLVEVILRSLSVTRNRSAGINNNVLDFSFRATNPAESLVVLNAVIDSYRKFLDATFRDTSGEMLKLIQKEHDMAQQDLAKHEMEYQRFRQQATVLLSGTKDGTTLAKERLSSIESKLSTLLVRKAEIRSYLEAIEAGVKSGDNRDSLLAMASGWSAKLDSEGKGPVDRPTLNSELYALLQEEQKLLESRGENHFEIKALRQRIELARNYLGTPLAAWRQTMPQHGSNDAAARPVESFREYFTQQLNQVEASLKLFSDLYREEFAKAKLIADYEMEDERWRRTIVNANESLKNSNKKLSEVNLVANVGGYDAQTIAPAGVGRKVAPRITVIFPVALLLGGIAGLGLALLAEWRDKSFRNADEIRACLGLRIVGQIPFFKLRPASDGKSLTDASPFAPSLVTHHQPKSLEAEAYRNLRTSLYFSIDSRGHKVIQVASPNSDDGKTTMAANLAVSIAQSGRKVLLIDADMRKPTIHQLFGLSSEAGLSSVIDGKLEPNEAIREVSIAGLSILPCGPIPPNPAELLTSPRFEECLKYLREHFDFVIIDTPPLLAVTDPSIVAHHVDGVFLNVRVTKNGQSDALRARDMLVNLKANIIGVVVNDSEAAINTSVYGDESWSRPGEGDTKVASNELVKA